MPAYGDVDYNSVASPIKYMSKLRKVRADEPPPPPAPPAAAAAAPAAPTPTTADTVVAAAAAVAPPTHLDVPVRNDSGKDHFFNSEYWVDAIFGMTDLENMPMSELTFKLAIRIFVIGALYYMLVKGAHVTMNYFSKAWNKAPAVDPVQGM